MSGWVLITLGIPLFPTPIPGGVVLAAAGSTLLIGACPTLRRRLP